MDSFTGTDGSTINAGGGKSLPQDLAKILQDLTKVLCLNLNFFYFVLFKNFFSLKCPLQGSTYNEMVDVKGH